MLLNKYNLVDRYTRLIRSQSIEPRYRLELLDAYENSVMDLTNDLSNEDGNLVINYAQGVRRSFSFSLIDTAQKYQPRTNGLIWLDTPFKLYLGVYDADIDDVYWFPTGIFYLDSYTRNDGDGLVNFTASDKFSRLAGSPGTLQETHIIPIGTKVVDAITDILQTPLGNGTVLDPIPPLIDSSLKEKVTGYTITHESGSTLGDILIEIANIFSADIYYNENGQLVLKNNTDDIYAFNRPTLWHFKDKEAEYIGGDVSVDLTAVYNAVRVVGDNINGEIFEAYAENRNEQSEFYVGGRTGRRFAPTIHDENIYSGELAQQRAIYELEKLTRMQKSSNITSSFMPHLDVDNIIELDSRQFGVKDERHIIQSISYSLTDDANVSISATTLRELPYYGTA